MKFTQAARKHRIGRAHAKFVISEYEPEAEAVSDLGERKMTWIAEDDRGIELEIIAVEATDTKTGGPFLLVLHVMPTALRK